MGFYRDETTMAEGTYWRQVFGLEAHGRRTERGGMFYVRYSLDDLPLYNGVPRFSRDNLLEIGVSLYL